MSALLRGYPVEVGDQIELRDVNHRPKGSPYPRVTVTKIGRTRVHWDRQWGGKQDSADLATGRHSDWEHVITIAEADDLERRREIIARLKDDYGLEPVLGSRTLPIDALAKVLEVLDASEVRSHDHR